MASLVYNFAKSGFADGTLDCDSGTQVYKTMLVASAYTPDPDQHFVSSVTNELSGTGYTGGFAGSGRKALASRTATTNTTNDRAELSAANVTWTAINAGTAAAAVIYKENTSDADSVLVAYIDIVDVVTNGGDFTIQWATNGIINL